MNRTMAKIVWLLLCSLTFQSTKVFGFTHNLQSIELSTADQTEIYDRERTAEINLQDTEVSTADQTEIYDKERTADINLQNIEVSTADQTEIYDKERTVEINLQDIEFITADQTKSYDKERTAEIITNSNVDVEEAVLSQYTRQAEENDCDYLSGTKDSEHPRKIKEIQNETYSFFLRPKENFVKLIIQMRLQDKLDISSIFYTKQNIELHSWDLDNQENKWVKVQVEYQPIVSRGPNYHALRVSVDNTTHSMITNYWQLVYTYEGFVLSTDGEVEFLFNCSPEEYLGEIPLPSSKWKWILAGCLMSVTLMLGAVCCVTVSKKKSENQNDISSSSGSHVYEEFDEEVLAKIRQKVEILREGRGYENSDCVSKDNHYVVLQMIPLQQQSSIPEEKGGKEEEQEEEEEKVPGSIRREEYLQQKVCLRENDMKSDCFTEENHYEILYPLDNSLSTGNEALQDPTTTTTTLPHNHLSTSNEALQDPTTTTTTTTTLPHNHLGEPLQDPTTTTTTLPHNHLASRDLEGQHSDPQEENPYENLYMAT